MAAAAAATMAAVPTTALEIDEVFMTLLEDVQAGETEEQRLNCVIQSLETEIESSTTSGREGFMVPNSSDWQQGLLDDDLQYMEPTCHVDDPFRWMDMDMVPNTLGHGMGQWYMDACMDDIGIMTQFGDQYVNYDDGQRDYASYYAEAPIEHELSPLWH